MISTLTIGQSGRRIPISTIADVTAPVWRKGACFDKLANTLRNQTQSYPIADLLTALEEALPIETTPAVEEATAVQQRATAAVMDINNLEPICFLDGEGNQVQVKSPDISDRPSGLTYIRLNCCIKGSDVDTRIKQPPLDIQFCLKLPQSIRDSAGVVIKLSDASNSTSASATSNAKQSRLFADSASTSGGTTSWHGSADVLDNAETFKAEFGTGFPLLLNANPKDGDHQEPNLALRHFAERCMFDVVLELCQSDYVGSNNVTDSTLAVQEVCKEIGSIQQEFKERNGKRNIRCPDEIFSKYLQLTPSLPCDTSLWTLQLSSTYFNALTNDLKDRMISDGFKMPSTSGEQSKDKELAALRKVREAATSTYKKLCDELKMMSRYMNAQQGTRLTGKHLLCAALLEDQPGAESNTPVYEVDHPRQEQPYFPPPQHGSNGRLYTYQSASPAESTLTRYKSPAKECGNNTIDESNPYGLPTRRGPTGLQHPYDREDPKSISKFPIGFKGCFKCGSLDHWLSSRCSAADTHGSKKEFFRELWIHKPHTKKLNSTPQRNTPIGSNFFTESRALLPPEPVRRVPHPSTPQPDQNRNGKRRAIDNNPAWLKDVAKKVRIEDERPPKEGRLWVYYAKVLVSQLAKLRIRPMPLKIDNGLPGVVLRVGKKDGKEVSFLCHVDTCAAMNTGNLRLHQYIITRNPELVQEYIQHDDAEPFEPIKLLCAVEDKPDTTSTTDTGRLTAVVRYKTPYTTTEGKPVLLSFGLGADVAVRTIIGLPTLREWKAVVDFADNTLTVHNLKKRFTLLFAEAESGLPQGVEFRPEQFQRPPHIKQGQVMKLSVSTYETDLQASAITDGCGEGYMPGASTNSNETEGDNTAAIEE